MLPTMATDELFEYQVCKRALASPANPSGFWIAPRRNVEPLRQDCTRAWLVLLSAFIASAFTLGNALTLGVMFNPIHALFPDAHASQINMVFALTAALTYMTGTMASTITSTIGYRITMLVGALLACIGFISASFVTQLWHLYLSVGVTTGIGFGIIFTPAIGVIPFYFTRYRRFAVTTATMGVGIGVMFYSRFHTVTLAACGWRGAMQIEAALTVVLFFCGIVVRDPPRSHHAADPVTIKLHDKSAYWKRPRERGGSSENLTISQTQTVSVVPELTIIPGGTTPEETVAAHEMSAVETEAGAGGWHLFLLPKFYFIPLQGLTLMCSSLFLITTTPFLTKTQHWSTLHAAFALTLFGMAALAMRISLCLFNVFASRLAKRLHAAVPIGAGNVMIVSAACVYFFTVTKQQQQHEDGHYEEQHDNLGVNETTSALGNMITTPEESLFNEHNALLLLTFAAVSGAGHATFLAYQTALIVDMLGAPNLTAGFGYLNFVWGVATLLLYPAAGWISDLFGGMRYEYMLGVVCGVFSLSSLLMASTLHSRDIRRRPAVVIIATTNPRQVSNGNNDGRNSLH